MIGALRGSFISQNGHELLIDVGGVGYEVYASGKVLGLLPDAGGEIKVVVFTDVKENSISLFAFSDKLEKEVFLLLKKVKGIGSRIAMNVLSAIGAEKILGIIGKGDIDSLKRIPGIGKKTAERLIVELRENVSGLVSESAEQRLEMDSISYPVSSFGNQSVQTLDATLALEKLGFTSERARRAVALAESSLPLDVRNKLDAGELLRLSLAQLSEVTH